jgi:hypothetical protein
MATAVRAANMPLTTIAIPFQHPEYSTGTPSCAEKTREIKDPRAGFLNASIYREKRGFSKPDPFPKS